MKPYKQDLWLILTFGRVEGDDEEEEEGGEEISSFSVTEASAAAFAETEREKLLLLGMGKGRHFLLRQISAPLSVNTGKVATEHAMEATTQRKTEAWHKGKGMKKRRNLSQQNPQHRDTEET